MVIPARSKAGCACASGDSARMNFEQEKMIVRAAADDAEAALRQSRSEGFGVGDDLLLILAEFRLHRFLQADRLGRDDVHERAALPAGEQIAVHILGVLFAAEDEAAARAAQRLVRRGGDEVRVRNGAGMHARRDQSGDVRHVDEKHSAHGLRDFGHAREIDDARVGARADDDHLGLVLLGEAVELVVIDGFGFFGHAVGDELVHFARKNSGDARA